MSIDLKDAKCYCVTFNACDTKLTEISALLPAILFGQVANDFDIFVIGLQNSIDPVASLRDYTLRLDVHFSKAGKSVKHFTDVGEGSVATLVYMKESYRNFVDESSIVKCGVTAEEAKAEACVLKFKLDGTVMTFTNMKLTGGKWHDNLKLLYQDINSKLYDGVDYLADSNASILFGCFDSYLDVYEPKIVNTIKVKKWTELITNDPLKCMQKEKKILSDFHEMTVTFPPTQNYKLHSGQKIGYTDRIFFKSSKGCNIKPFAVQTRSGSQDYFPMMPPEDAFKFTRPVTAGLVVRIHNVHNLKKSLRGLKFNKEQLPRINVKTIQLNLNENSVAAAGSIYLSFNGSWMEAGVNNRAFFAKYGELNKTWSSTQLPNMKFKPHAIFAGIDEGVLQYQNLAITLMHQNGISDDVSCGTAVVHLAPSFSYGGDYNFEQDILYHGEVIGSIHGVLETTYGNKKLPKKVEKKTIKKKKNVKGVLKGKFKLFAKKALKEKKFEKDIEKQNVAFTISGAKEDFVNGEYYAFLKRFNSALNAERDTAFNTKVAYRNCHHVIVSFGTKHDADGWVIELLGEKLYFCRHKSDMDVPLKGYASWTNAHRHNPIISIPKPLPSKSELLRIQKEEKIVAAMKDVKRHTKKAIAIKKLNMVNAEAEVEGIDDGVAGSTVDNLINEETSLAVEQFEKDKISFVSSLIQKKYLSEGKDDDGSLYITVFGTAWGQEERAKIGMYSDPTSIGIKLCQDPKIKFRLPKLTACPMRTKIEGVMAVCQVPILRKLLHDVEADIDDAMYRLSKLYIMAANDISALEEALEVYEGTKHTRKLKAKYRKRLEVLESGET